MFLIQLSSNDGIESEDFPHEFWIDGDDDVFAAPESFTADEWQKISDESHSVSWPDYGVVRILVLTHIYDCESVEEQRVSHHR